MRFAISWHFWRKLVARVSCPVTFNLAFPTESRRWDFPTAEVYPGNLILRRAYDMQPPRHTFESVPGPSQGAGHWILEHFSEETPRRVYPGAQAIASNSVGISPPPTFHP